MNETPTQIARRICPNWMSPTGDAHYKDVTNALEKQHDQITLLRELTGKLLEDLNHRTSDRADSSLPEWEEEARRLGVLANAKVSNSGANNNQP